MTDVTADVVIIGGGIHGCSTALNIARRGLSVVVIEKDHVGRHASSANAGGVRTLGRDPREIALSLFSLDQWHDIASIVGADCGFQPSGQLRIAETPEDLARLEERAATVRALGFNHEEFIGPAEVYEILPALRPGCVGGLICRRDGSANPLTTMRAFRAAVIAAGIDLREGTMATGAKRLGNTWRVDTSNGVVGAAILVNCAGAWADRVAAWIGDTVPVSAVAPAAMITSRVAPCIGPVVSAVSRPLSLKQFDNGTMLISGSLRGVAERDRNVAAIRLAPFAARAATVLDLFPAMREAQAVRFWAGIEAVTPDGCPVIGPSAAAEGAFHAFGFNGHGFELGPGCGAVMAELVSTGSTNMPIAGLEVDRFEIEPSRRQSSDAAVQVGRRN